MARDGSVAVASDATGLTRCGTEPTAVASAGRRPGNAALIASTFGVATDGAAARFGEMRRWRAVGFRVLRARALDCRSILARRLASAVAEGSVAGVAEGAVPLPERDRRRT